MPVVHRPAVAVLFLPLALLIDGAFCRNVNFHNVRPPMSPTPFPNSFKCFTCNNALDNYECNRWAEDKWCPHYTAYCLTVHRFTSHGRSESVSKRCVSKEECHSVGCHHFRKFGYTECISCCEGMICNIEVPTNHTNAVVYGGTDAWVAFVLQQWGAEHNLDHSTSSTPFTDLMQRQV